MKLKRCTADAWRSRYMAERTMSVALPCGAIATSNEMREADYIDLLAAANPRGFPRIEGRRLVWPFET